MAMSKTFEGLQAMTDQEVIAAHDNAAKNTVVGTSYWIEEMERRSRARFEASADRLTRESIDLARSAVKLATATVILAAVSIVIAIVALFVR